MIRLCFYWFLNMKIMKAKKKVKHLAYCDSLT